MLSSAKDEMIYDSLSSRNMREFELEQQKLKNELALVELRQQVANKKRAHTHLEENENTAHNIKIMEGNRAHYSGQQTTNISSMHQQVVAVDGAINSTQRVSTPQVQLAQSCMTTPEQVCNILQTFIVVIKNAHI